MRKHFGRVLSDKHLQRREGWCLEIEHRNHMSTVWKHILDNYEFSACSAQLQVGDGQRIRLWEDPWLNNKPLKDAFPNLSGIACQTGITLKFSLDIFRTQFTVECVIQAEPL